MIMVQKDEYLYSYTSFFFHFSDSSREYVFRLRKEEDHIIVGLAGNYEFKSRGIKTRKY